MNETVEAHALNTGALAWHAAIDAEYSFPDGHGLLFVRTAHFASLTSAYFTITALHTADGSVAWRYQVADTDDIVAEADGLVMAGVSHVYPTTLTALHGSTGAVAWQAQISGSILSVIPT